MSEIKVSKCCGADIEELFDGAGYLALIACKRCQQECQTIVVCETCRGTGKCEEWRAPDDVITTKCPDCAPVHDGDGEED